MWPECGVIYQPVSSAEVKGRVELYFYSPSVPSLQVIRVKFTFYVFYKHKVLSGLNLRNSAGFVTVD